MTLIIYFKK